MITLQNKLYESLLDDEDDLVNNDKNILDEIIKDPQGPVQTLYKNTMDFWNTYNDIKIKENILCYDSSVTITNNPPKKLSSILNNIDTIQADTLYFDKGLKKYDGKLYCENFKLESIHMTNLEELTNTNIEFIESNLSFSNHVSIGSNLNSGKTNRILFNKVNFISFKNRDIDILIRSDNFPIFKNTNFVCKNLFINYNPNNPIEFLKNLEKFLDKNYKCKIQDYKNNEILELPMDRKRIKNITIDRIYEPMNDLFKLVPGTTIDDIFNTKIPNAINNINVNCGSFSINIYKKSKIIDKNLYNRPLTYYIDLNNDWLLLIKAINPKNKNYEKLHKNKINNYDNIKK